jgi:hypothetical protein
VKDQYFRDVIGVVVPPGIQDMDPLMLRSQLLNLYFRRQETCEEKSCEE